MAEQVSGNVTIKGFVIGPVVVNDYVLGVVQNEENEYALQIQRGGETQTIPVVSPIMTTEAIEGGTRVTIEDISGTRSFDILNGKDGIDGKDGQDGKDGISPVVAVTEIENGHRVTITDAEGEKTFDVPNGGSGMPEGGAPYQQLVTDGEGNAKWEDRLAYSNELVKATFPLYGDTGIDVYKVADEIPAFLRDAAQGDYIVAWINGTPSTGAVAMVTDACLIAAEFLVAVSYKDNAEVLLPNGMVLGTLPEKGVYFTKMANVTVTGVAPAGATSPEIEWDGQTSVVKPIDPKYLPEGVGGGGVFYVDAEWGTYGDNLIVTNVSKTYAEMLAAYDAGKQIVLRVFGTHVENENDVENSVVITYITPYEMVEIARANKPSTLNELYIMFQNIYTEPDMVYVSVIRIKDDNRTSLYEVEYAVTATT